MNTRAERSAANKAAWAALGKGRKVSTMRAGKGGHTRAERVAIVQYAPSPAPLPREAGPTQAEMDEFVRTHALRKG